ncbi:coproporphyrinogen-III oxidase family protein [[Clostridium] polysaccharolyticum]|uniref:Coproporphyrinogen-III oxidase n=1 Tax=[Clostridium] polysaccharolyticum TaxID=29364 RepID=A0A1I0ED24_9FIRM|nr:radical SAM protein [[Clostridium] polysaccharolyticum]SET42674.1 oxygen-independent coproporphyrinogen-3 oxidase [[Clostridium] polysaccharolyticum]
MNYENMKQLHLLAQKYEEYDKPLYLGYPIENSFDKKVTNTTIQDYGDKLNSADLYIHIPFCRKMCYFCCCYRVAFQNEIQMDQYVDAIQKELLLKFGQKEKMVYTSMHWGGGTPAVLTEKQIERLYHSIETYFTPAAGNMTNIEAYPNRTDITSEKLKLLKQLGFNSISFGIQDFDKRVQKAINREYEVNETLKIMDMAKKEGFMVHIDLCYGLPFQGLNEFEKTLEAVMKIEPEQIAAYPYMHYTVNFPLQNKILVNSIPNSFMKLLLSMLAKEKLADNYTKYGMDTFIRKNSSIDNMWKSSKIVRNMMGTNIDTGNLLYGLGMSAISRWENGYEKNTDSLKEYEETIFEGKLPIIREHIMTKEDKLRHFLIEEQIGGIRQINKKQIEKRIGIPFFEKFARQYEKMVEFEKDGLIAGLDEDIIYLTDIGSEFTRCIAHIFNEYCE